MSRTEGPSLAELAARSGCYTELAFVLVQEALELTTSLVAKGKLGATANLDERRVDDGVRFHVTGQELLEGFRIYMQRTYGNLAWLLLQRCGLRSGEDVGRVVFLLVEARYMGKRDSDSPADFAGGYDFATVFAPSSLLE
jgi:uncharacterized repeat protein (TIGR04138 family)